MIKSSHVDQPLGSVLHGEVGLVAHHVVDEVEAVGRQGGGEHVLVVWRLQHHCHPQSGFFQRKGQKRVKEWREVTFMKEWVKALYIGYHQELDLPKNLFPFPRTVQLKISLGPIRFLYSKFHGLLKLIFHTNQYNGA